MKRIPIILFVLISLSACGNSAIESSLDTTLTDKEVEVFQLSKSGNTNLNSSYVGKVSSENIVEIRSEASGTVIDLLKNEGDLLKIGGAIIKLDDSLQSSDLKNAQAALSAARSNLNKLKNGARSEEVEITKLKLNIAEKELEKMQNGARSEDIEMIEVKIQAAEASLEDAKLVLEQTKKKTIQDNNSAISNSIVSVQAAKTAADHVINVQLEELVIQSKTVEACLYKFRTTYYREAKLECSHAVIAAEEIEDLLSQFDKTSDVKNILIETNIRLDIIYTYLEELAKAIEHATSEVEFKTITIERRNFLRNSVLQARNEIEGAKSTITNQINQLSSIPINGDVAVINATNHVNELQRNLEILNKELEISKKGARREDIAIQVSRISQLKLELQVADGSARSEDLQSQIAIVNQAKANLEKTAIQVEKSVIRAPFNGRLLELPIHKGDYVNIGQVIAQIADESSKEIVVFVSENDVSSISKHAKVQVEYQDIIYDAKIKEISTSINDNTKSKKITIKLLNIKNTLPIGSTVNVLIEKNNIHTNMVPLTSIKFSGSQAFILYADSQNIVQSIAVELGNVTGDYIEIEDGVDDKLFFIKDSRGVKVGDHIILKS